VALDEGDPGEQLSAVQELFRQLSDLLFSFSQQLARTGGPNWDRAEALFRLAKGADLLRDNVLGVLSQRESRETQLLFTTPDTSSKPATRNQGLGAKPARKKRDYPKYCVRGDLLVKTGLSRDGRNEYEHLVPKKEFDEISSILTQFAKTREQFTVAEVHARLDCPAYQIYTVLSLLKARKLLLVPRRGLYSFKVAKAFPTEAANLWEALRN
jgi:hypothetical protein